MTTNDAPRGVLAELSDALAGAVEKAAASTVLVNARRQHPASGIIWSAEGAIVTADHVIEREEEIKVGLPDGRELAATLAGRDPSTDIAVLRVQGGGLTPLERAPEGSVKVGHLSLAVGRPASGGPMASMGVVSTLGPWRTMSRRGRPGPDTDAYIRSDLTFYPGFSGGPLVDTSGRMLGLNSSRLGRGAGLTVRTGVVARVAEALLTGGRIRRGYLGIGSQPAKLPEALAARLGGQASGLLVVSVEPGAAAERAGIMLGDIVVKMAGAAITDIEDLQAQLGTDSVGRSTTITILRGGEPRELAITVGERT